MKKRSDMYLSQENKSSALVCFTMKKSSGKSLPVPAYTYLPFDFSRQLFTGVDALDYSKSSMSSSSAVKNDECRNTFVYRMTSVILSVIEHDGCECDEDNCCTESFYASCVSRYLSMYSDVNDHELLVIFAKQIMIMLKQSGAVSVSGSRAFSTACISETLYTTVFNSFWTGVSWSRLFPSMPSLADALQNDRYILIELLASREGLFSVEDIARDYYSFITVPCDDMLLYVSFFDYSFFAWMSHFGIIRYRGEKENVSAELTGWGKNFLEILV